MTNYNYKPNEEAQFFDRVQKYDPNNDFYQLFGLAVNASPGDIKRAFRTQSLQHHPDKNSNSKTSTATFQKINEMYQVLNDPMKRKIYDKRRAQHLRQSNTNHHQDAAHTDGGFRQQRESWQQGMDRFQKEHESRMQEYHRRMQESKRKMDEAMQRMKEMAQQQKLERERLARQWQQQRQQEEQQRQQDHRERMGQREKLRQERQQRQQDHRERMEQQEKLRQERMVRQAELHRQWVEAEKQREEREAAAAKRQAEVEAKKRQDEEQTRKEQEAATAKRHRRERMEQQEAEKKSEQNAGQNPTIYTVQGIEFACGARVVDASGKKGSVVGQTTARFKVQFDGDSKSTVRAAHSITPLISV